MSTYVIEVVLPEPLLHWLEQENTRSDGSVDQAALNAAIVEAIKQSRVK